MSPSSNTRARINEHDHSSGPGLQTLGEAIVAAHEAVERAETERTRLLGLALTRGASTRQIAPLLGVGHSTVWRWAGGKRLDRDALGRPVAADEEQHVASD